MIKKNKIFVKTFFILLKILFNKNMHIEMFTIDKTYNSGSFLM